MDSEKISGVEPTINSSMNNESEFMDFREKNRKDRKKQLIYSKYWIHYFPSRIINHKTCKVVFISIREYYFEYWLGFWTNCPKVMKKVFFQNGF